MKIFFLFIAVFSIGISVFAQTKQVGKLKSEFEYDAKLPLEINEISVKEQNGVKIHDITYPSLKGGRVTAFLVAPSSKGKFAGIIFLHSGPGNRSSFLDEAIALAQNGAVSLLIDAPFRRPEPWRRSFNPPKDPENEKELYLQTVLDLRRGVDLLRLRKDVDKERIGYVGHSFGATWGGVLAGVDRRIKAFVLIAGRPSLTEWIKTTKDPNVAQATKTVTPKELENYLAILAPLDTIHYIGNAKPASLFFQFARQDESVLPSEAETIIPFLREPKAVKWYETDHQGLRTNENSLRDRTVWLEKKLNLKPVVKK